MKLTLEGIKKDRMLFWQQATDFLPLITVRWQKYKKAACLDSLRSRQHF